jgi:mRNA-degrading endonuclease toxin of MazEF toxin-antitoxin module
VRQGEVYWLAFAGRGSQPDGRRPAVVVQHDRFNRSAIQTTVVAAVTSTVDRERLSEMVGNLSPARVREVLAGSSLVLGLDALGEVGGR